jgi:flagellar protein FliS
MYNNSSLNAYKQQSMNVTSKPKLIEMMYEGILRFLSQALRCSKEDNIEKKVYWINRTISIYGEFIAILDYKQGGEVAHYLNGLYTHQIKVLSESILYTDNEKQRAIDIIQNSINLTKELLEAWYEVN